MDDILRRIIEIEDRAQKMVEDTKRENADFDKNIEQIVEKLKIETENKIARKIEYIEETEIKHLQESIEEARETCEHNTERLDKIYSENKDKWIQDAYDGIIYGRRRNA